MKHLIISREYPPAPGGGIGTYVDNISRLLAEAGETVHVIGQKWEGADKDVEEKISGRLIIHRIPLHDWSDKTGQKIHPELLSSNISSGLYNYGYFPQCFSYNAAILSEKLVSEEGIDVIEAQEFEAPLYYLQLRRALGFGPKTKPPCIVHLHTPTEFTAKYNDWDINDPYIIYAIKFETFTIGTADSIISPSVFLANCVKDNYGIKDRNIEIIPYPLGNDIGFIHRKKTVWESGKLTYIGRLERRKGVIEYINSAVALSKEFPAINFDFVGGNVIEPDSTSVKELLLGNIPNSLKPRFIFHQHMNRSELKKVLSESKICVVPSRFENYPNTCMEAMNSGIPVVSSPFGGMVEMIENNISGWISKDLSIEGLASTIKTAISTSSQSVENMGLNASRRINSICDNQKIVNMHLEYKSRIICNNNKISINLPSNILWKSGKFTIKSGQNIDHSGSGIALVLMAFRNRNWITDTLKNIENQKKKPTDIIIFSYDKITQNEITENLDCKFTGNVHILDVISGNLGISLEILIKFLNELDHKPLGISILEEGMVLDENYFEIMESILIRHKNVGIISSWASINGDKNKLLLNSCIMLPYQIINNEIITSSVIRTEALIKNKYRALSSNKEFGYSDLFNIVLLDGWLAIAVPLVLTDLMESSLKQKQATNNMLNNYLTEFIAGLEEADRNEFIKEITIFLPSITRLNYIINDLTIGKNWFEKLSSDRLEWIDTLTDAKKYLEDELIKSRNELIKVRGELAKANKYNLINISKKAVIKLKQVINS